MLRLKMTQPDVRVLRLGFALLLEDRFSGAGQFAGEISVRLLGSRIEPMEKVKQGVFLFVGVAAGNYIVQVRSNPANGLPPYYAPVDLPIHLPMPDPMWPAFPDISLADPNRALDDPTQPAAYRDQREWVRLHPTVAYPFPPDATLIRGTVYAAGVPLARAEVRDVSGGPIYRTAEDGEYVLFFHEVAAPGAIITLEASHPGYLDQQQNVFARRGFAVTAPDFVMP